MKWSKKAPRTKAHSTSEIEPPPWHVPARCALPNRKELALKLPAVLKEYLDKFPENGLWVRRSVAHRSNQHPISAGEKYKKFLDSFTEDPEWLSSSAINAADLAKSMDWIVRGGCDPAPLRKALGIEDRPCASRCSAYISRLSASDLRGSSWRRVERFAKDYVTKLNRAGMGKRNRFGPATQLLSQSVDRIAYTVCTYRDPSSHGSSGDPARGSVISIARTDWGGTRR